MQQLIQYVVADLIQIIVKLAMKQATSYPLQPEQIRKGLLSIRSTQMELLNQLRSQAQGLKKPKDDPRSLQLRFPPIIVLPQTDNESIRSAQQQILSPQKYILSPQKYIRSAQQQKLRQQNIFLKNENKLLSSSVHQWRRNYGNEKDRAADYQQRFKTVGLIHKQIIDKVLVEQDIRQVYNFVEQKMMEGGLEECGLEQVLELLSEALHKDWGRNKKGGENIVGQLSQLRTQISTLLDSRKDQNQYQQDKLRTQQNTIRTQQNTIRTLQNTIRTLQNTIRTQQGTIRTQQGTIRTQQGTIRTQQGTISTQQNAIRVLEDQITALKDNKMSQQDKIKARQDTTQTFIIQIRELEQRLISKQNQIMAKQNQMMVKQKQIMTMSQKMRQLETDNKDLLAFWRLEKEDKQSQADHAARGRRQWQEREKKIIIWAKEMQARAVKAEKTIAIYQQEQNNKVLIKQQKQQMNRSEIKQKEEKIVFLQAEIDRQRVSSRALEDSLQKMWLQRESKIILWVKQMEAKVKQMEVKAQQMEARAVEAEKIVAERQRADQALKNSAQIKRKEVESAHLLEMEIERLVSINKSLKKQVQELRLQGKKMLAFKEEMKNTIDQLNVILQNKEKELAVTRGLLKESQRQNEASNPEQSNKGWTNTTRRLSKTHAAVEHLWQVKEIEYQNLLQLLANIE